MSVSHKLGGRERNKVHLLGEWLSSASFKLNVVHNYLTDIRDDLFEGCIVCPAGGSIKQKGLVQSLVERYSGLYDENMDIDTCSHLLVWKLEGTFKFTVANTSYCVLVT